MVKTTRPGPEWTLGIDLGDRKSCYCWMDPSGEVVESGEVKMSSPCLTDLVGKWKTRVRVAMEVGTHSGWVSDLLTGLGHEVFVANTHRMKLIAKSNRKTDRADAELLARIARADPTLLCPIRHRGKEAREDLQLLRSRDALVRTRTDLINHVRGTVKAAGGRVSSCSAPSFPKKALPCLPDALRPVLRPVIELIASLTETIREFDRRIHEVCKERYPETKILRQVQGIGPITSLCYVLTLDDPGRFASSREVGAYVGLRPRLNQSGERDPELGITKAGDGHLRRLLVSASHYILGHWGKDSDLRRWGHQLAQRGGKNAKKRAVVAVARKLAVLLHALWKHEAVYEPLRPNPGPRRHRRPA